MPGTPSRPIDQTQTWGRSIESFEMYLARDKANVFDTPEVALSRYLSAQLREEGAKLIGIPMPDPIMGLLDYMNEENNRAQELLFAQLALLIAKNPVPADALVKGLRLNREAYPVFTGSAGFSYTFGDQDPTLPCQSVTWGRSIETFQAFRVRHGGPFANDSVAVGFYLRDQLRLEGKRASQRTFNHPVCGLMAYMAEDNNRAQELMLAYLALTLMHDQVLAAAVLMGYRIERGLPAAYVEATRCYG